MAISLDKIRSTAERVAASHDLEVVEIDYQSAQKQRVLRVFIEKSAEQRARLIAEARAAASNPVSEDMEFASGLGAWNPEQVSGVTHEDCEKFSRDFGTVLDVEDLMTVEDYTLEVSSPGLDRKLRTAGDFERFAGNLVKVQTFEPIAGNRHWQGRLTQVAGGKITIDRSALKQKGKSRKIPSETVEIELSNVEKANLVPEI
ncbi:ribosome maturation factor [Silvibacterium acidisoli]|uniref:ribosome maturation factor n=1 Tax=Acidobacteriaceae bacterium ZG23-2 TaxID=2883246 RepID=UPI00406CC815